MDAFETLDFKTHDIDQVSNGQTEWSEPLLQQFDIRQPLGKGGQGSVFLAYEYRLKRYVAIKRIHHQGLNAQLLVEAQAQAQIYHPNISKLFQVVQAHSLQAPCYLVMEYIEGQTALEWAAQKRAACDSKAQWRDYVELVVSKIVQICDGLQALHSKGIVHRDIKPANIMITDGPTEHPYIVDFGLAQHQEHISHTVSGSKPFMSPEQKNGDPLSSASDIYSLGVTIYQLLTAHLPETTDDSLTRSMQVDETASFELPIELVTIINKCLATQRQDRFQSAFELSEELRRFLTNEPIKSIDAIGYRINKKLSKHSYSVLFVFILIIAGIAQAAWIQHQKSRVQEREQLVEQFHQTVQQAQYQSNLAYMAPPHDIRYLQSRHQHNLAQIISHAEKLGATAQPFALYAKGRIAQQQGNYLEAKKQLTGAWEKGFRTEESAYSQVLVLNALYQQALTRLYVMPHGPLRQAQQAQLQQQFVEPIISYLKFIQQPSERSSNRSNQHYIRALLAYYNQDYQQAIELLSSAEQFSPWQYQHHILLAQNYVAQYQRLLKPSSEQAERLLTKAKQAFDKAIAIAPSDPKTYLQKWQLFITLVGNSQFGSGNTLESLNSAQQLLTQAQKIHPQHFDTQAFLIRTQFQRMVYLANQGESWHEALEDTLSTVEQALQQWPEQPKLLRLKAKVLSYQLAHGTVEKTDEQYQTIGLLYQQLLDQQHLGFDDLIYYALHQKRWGDFIEDKPRSRRKYQLAEMLFRNAIASKPEYSGSYVNLALVELKLSEIENTIQALVRLKDARSQLMTALDKGYSEFVANYYLAKTGIEISNKLGSTDLTNSINALEDALSAIKNAQIAKPNNYHAVGLEIEVLSQLVENHWYLAKPKADLAQQLVTIQLQRLDDEPEQLLALSHCSYILTSMLEKQLLLAEHTQRQQQVVRKLKETLTAQINSSEHNTLDPEQTLALSNLLYSEIVNRQNPAQLAPLIALFKRTAKTADYYWTLANYHQLKSQRQSDTEQQLAAQANAIKLWQQAYQINPDNIGYHFSLLKGYLQQLILAEQAEKPSLLLNTRNKINQLNLALDDSMPLKQWSNTLLQQQQSGKLIDYLKANKSKNPFTLSLMAESPQFL